jgi:hypothetical protein
VATSSDDRTDDAAGFLARPADDLMLQHTEDLLRVLRECVSAEAAAARAAARLPELIGVDWAEYSPAQGAANRAHGFLAAASLRDSRVYSQGAPPTVAAIPVVVAGAPVGVILMGRRSGLVVPQLQIAAVCAEHAGKVVPGLALARTA